MILAVIGAVRGNFQALDRVIAEIDDAGIELICCTGDLVFPGTEGSRIIRRLIDRGVTCVQGTQDKQVVRARRKETTLRRRVAEEEAAAWVATYSALRGEDIEWLRSLSFRRDLHVDQRSIIVCHGSLTSQSAPLESDMPLSRFERQRELVPADLIVCGGSSLPFQRLVAGTLFVNPGDLASQDHIQWTCADLERQPFNAVLHSRRF